VATRKSPKPRALSARELRAITRVLSDPRRFEILRRIAAQSCPAACADLRAAFPITPATLSHHLKELESAGLIETSREGKFVHAAFCRPVWEAYLKELQKI
jgi:ArsR family transcriptional regulator, arsenate/arsenite/antimonite-responsive transcriptional repressor